MKLSRIFLSRALTALTLLTLTVTLPRIVSAQTVAQNALALNISFNGADTTGTDDQLPAVDQFYTATKAYYTSLGKSMPGVRRCHAYVSWDVALQPAGSGSSTQEGSLVWLQTWLANEQGHCDDALITFKWYVGISCVYYTGCALGTTEEPPHPVEVGNALSAFLAATWTGWTGTFAFTPWNEPNNAAVSGDGFDNGDTVGARTAADYYLAMRDVCIPANGCSIAAGDFASNGSLWQDSIQNCADDTAALCGTATYMDTFKHYLNNDATAYGLASGFRPEIFAFHGWSDANDYLNSNANCDAVTTKTCVTWLTYYAFATDTHSANTTWTGVKFWDTEVGIGQDHTVASPTNDEQAKAAAFIMDLSSTVSSRFWRLYYTRAWESDGAYWSLICSDGSTVRPSFTVWADRQTSYTNTGSTCP